VSSDFSLNDFSSEPGVAPGDTALVSDILARGVRVNWDEAVALWQEVLESVTVSDAPIPAFNDIVIDAAGAVRIQRSRLGERGPVAAGRALHALLATADIPVALRLFVTQANSPDTHSSLETFATGLAYFGRPGRAELIGAIYQRYRSSGSAGVATPSQSVVPPIRSSIRADQTPELGRRTHVRWLMPAAIVLCAVSSAAAIWFGLGGAGRSGETSVMAQAKAAIAAVTPTSDSTPAPVSGSATMAEKAPDRQDTPAASARSRRPSTANRTVPPNVARGSSTLRTITPVLSEPLVALIPTPESAPSAAPTPPPTDARDASREHAATIYSHDDADVEPPVMRHSALPPPVFVARAADSVFNRMELVIAADGSVERVRLLNGPTRMPDMMLLSGAKLWRFTPALKDGVPVRYRTTVTWTGFP
jgi:hypothetical protein